MFFYRFTVLVGRIRIHVDYTRTDTHRESTWPKQLTTRVLQSRAPVGSSHCSPWVRCICWAPCASSSLQLSSTLQLDSGPTLLSPTGRVFLLKDGIVEGRAGKQLLDYEKRRKEKAKSDSHSGAEFSLCSWLSSSLLEVILFLS